ncbi:MAG: hypothetical protein ACOYOK_00135 [Pseudobdellovibrionaceae bacterium]
MKLIILCCIATLSFAGDVFASCPDISGSYQSGDQIFVGYEQTDCQFLKRYYGNIVADGSVSYSFDKQFKNGNAVCSKSGACETVKFTQDAVVFELNFNGGVLTDDHGHCSHRKYSLSKDTGGNLAAVFSVFACKDGFKGEARKVFLK